MREVSARPLDTIAASIQRQSAPATQDSLGDFIDLAEAVGRDEEASLVVRVDDGFGLLVVELLAASDYVLGVVGAAFDRC